MERIGLGEMCLKLEQTQIQQAHQTSLQIKVGNQKGVQKYQLRVLKILAIF